MAKIPTGLVKAIDRLFEVRQQLKELKAEDTELGTSIKAYMLDLNLDEVEAKQAYATISMRPALKIDAEAYLDALDGDMDKFLSSVTVRVDYSTKLGYAGARTYLGEETITAISDSEDVPVLNIKKLSASRQKSQAGKQQIKVRMA